MKIIVIGFVGIVDGSLAIGGIAIGDYSEWPEEVVVVVVVGTRSNDWKSRCHHRKS